MNKSDIYKKMKDEELTDVEINQFKILEVKTKTAILRNMKGEFLSNDNYEFLLLGIVALFILFMIYYNVPSRI